MRGSIIGVTIIPTPIKVCRNHITPFTGSQGQHFFQNSHNSLISQLNTVQETLREKVGHKGHNFSLPLQHENSLWFPEGSMFCNDQMFSGHTSIHSICIGFFFFWTRSLILRGLSILYLFFAISATLITRDHYTMDVLVALYTVLLTILLFRESIEKLYQQNHFESKNVEEKKSY